MRMRGLVIRNTGSSYVVLDGQGQHECHIKGNFRIKGIRSTNPIAVGDNVVYETQSDGTNWITQIEERRNYIVRRSTNLSKDSHILAANIDMVALIVTVNHPVTNTVFIDRFLATAQAYRIPALLIFNKIDLLDSDECRYLEALQGLYSHLGYQTIALSAIDLPADKDKYGRLLGILQGKTTLLSGNSGVGKSTLLNCLVGEDIARVGQISDAHNKGMHTTTFSAMYPLEPSHQSELVSESSTWLIDTPGIKGFGSFDMKEEEISHYFTEIFETGKNCRFSDCTHTNEPDCAVRKAVAGHYIAQSRYDSYLSMLGDCTESKYR